MKTAERLSHEQALELLPWLVAGTLADDEQAEVEQHLRNCVACRREQAFLARVCEGVRETDDAQLGARRSLQNLMTRIEPAHAAALSAQAGSRAKRWLPMAMAAGVLLAMTALLLPALRSPTAVGSDAGAFVALSDGAEAPPAGVWVRFAPGLHSDAITRWLLRNDVSIVRGPYAEGVYLLRAGNGDDAAMAKALARSGLADVAVPAEAPADELPDGMAPAEPAPTSVFDAGSSL